MAIGGFQGAIVSTMIKANEKYNTSSSRFPFHWLYAVLVAAVFVVHYITPILSAKGHFHQGL
jgi:hypothetical protein